MQKILSGSKTTEFRKVLPRQEVNFVLLYESAPTKLIVGLGRVSATFTGTKTQVWRQCRHSGGITRQEYDQYFSTKANASYLALCDVKRFTRPVSPKSFITGFTVPQSFCYLDERTVRKILKSSL